MTADVRFPLVCELAPPLRAEDVFLRLAALPHCLFLDSALRDPRLGRYSFVAADPFDYIEIPVEGPDGLAELARRLDGHRGQRHPDLPPFQGGAAGLLSYDLGRQLERLPAPAIDEFRVPAIALGLYDVVVAFDHVQNRAWIVSQGFPETMASARGERAGARLEQMLRWLEGDTIIESGETPADPLCAQPPEAEAAPQYRVRGPAGLASNFDEPGYLRAVERVIEYIRAGDAFQVNLAHRLLRRASGSPVDLYLRLRQRNPAPFAGYFDLGELQIASASPERFLRVTDGLVEARPIKGTHRRTARPEADLFAGEVLLASEKDRAENVMIVDLLRNDLSRVCLPESVRVTQLCGLEVYQYVQHLVSAVCGRLREGKTAVDLVRAAFPGGSITGAPKVRAMEIIAELEPTARGPYCGSLGYFGFDGAMDLSILIRTITAGRGWWQAPVGGGITARSDPRREYEETWHKAEGLLRGMAIGRSEGRSSE